MCRFLNALFFVVVITILFSCSSGEQHFDSADKIAVNWEIITNFTDEKTVFDARFSLTNNSNIKLTDNNWALFFNMAPRPILANKTPQPADLHHINGDWYKLTPNKDFSLEPGKSIAIDYRGTEGVIKDTDRPLGPYFVFYDAEGKEKNITEVSAFTWTPFTKPEQINRIAEDEEPIPTPAWIYKNNQGLTELQDNEIRSIVPSPVKLEKGSGTFILDGQVSIVQQRGLEKEAAYLAASLKDVMSNRLKIISGKSAGKSITLQLGKIAVNGISKEAYRLTVGENGIAITGSDAAGVFYGIQSLRSLIPIKNYQTPSVSISLPFLKVDDAPRFGFRGLHLDVSRNFQTKETILRTLDLLSFYKINRFLFYTTEDEGWRLEIKDLPELTEAGAQREHTYGKEAPVLHPGYGSGPFLKQEGKYGHGFYSRADFVEILKYANDRHIKVIPELNFPAHARAAIKAMESRYELLMKEGKETEANEYRLIDPNDKSVYLSAQGYTDNVVSVARESSFHFYEKVVDEIAAMYKEAGLTLDEFHSGGDEVPEGAWTKSPMAAELLKQHPEIKDPHNLQAYFVGELIKRLKKRNLQIHGWEEAALVKTGVASYEPNLQFVGQNVVLYIWNNMFDHPDLGYRLANAGYDVVLCNVSNFYFDLAYSKDPEEPGLYWAGFVDARNAWTFAPYDMYKTTSKNSMGQKLDLEGPHDAGKAGAIVVERLKPEARKHIVGVEAQVWSETIKGRDMLEYYMLPKLVGFAESAWGPERIWETIDNKEARTRVITEQWNVFANSIAKKELPRLSYLNNGYNYRVPAPGALFENGELKANVEYPGLIIRYTQDGTEPTANSPQYVTPVAVSGIIKLRTFDAAGKMSKTISVDAE